MERLDLKMEDLSYQGETKTGNDFSRAVIASATTNHHWIKIAYDTHGNLITDVGWIYQLAQYFQIEFKPGSIDGQRCFIEQKPRFKS